MKQIHFLVAMVLLTAIIENATATTQRTTTLNCLLFDSDQNNTGEGWGWKNDTKTLTLSGCDIAVSMGDGIYLPANSTIVLEAGSSNQVTTSAKNVNKSGIAVDGKLTITNAVGAIGTLSVSNTSSTLKPPAVMAFGQEMSLLTEEKLSQQVVPPQIVTESIATPFSLPTDLLSLQEARLQQIVTASIPATPLMEV